MSECAVAAALASAQGSAGQGGREEAAPNKALEAKPKEFEEKGGKVYANV